MMKLILLVIMFTLPLQPVRAEPAFEYGVRPVTGVFDPERSHSPELTRQLTDEPSKGRKPDLADGLVVVLPSTGEVPPDHLAHRFSDAWGKRLLHAVMLDAANRTNGPWVFFGNEVIYSDHNEIIP